MWLSRGRVPCLDGLRAVAILLVLLAHAGQSHGFPGRSAMDPVCRAAAIGVDVFFVVSGFLITLLLLRERVDTGAISLRGFYIRRGLRILPAYLMFVAVLFALTRIGLVELRWQDWVGMLTYTTNYVEHRPYETSHLWSLALEEQFYLLWPPLLLFLGPHRARYPLVAYLIAAPFFRVAARVFFPGYESLLHNSTLARMDSIAAGCLLTLLAANASFRWRTQLRGRAALLVGSFAVCVLLASLYARNRWFVYYALGSSTVNAMAIATLLWLCIHHHDGLVGRFLGSRPMVTLGTLSYSLYLWQQLFLNPHRPEWPCRWPISLALALVAAAASYLIVEAPFLRLKARLSR